MSPRSSVHYLVMNTFRLETGRFLKTSREVFQAGPEEEGAQISGRSSTICLWKGLCN